ncbi:MAG: phosphate signaling complex protein PhoU [Prevotellaceae bacterium]|jgi:phosphate transport system protein|nr:phosphate signaling complex protein PhoU [Prevotellaceae bacterium]
MKPIEKELSIIKKELNEMWNLVNSQLNIAGEALLSPDSEAATQVLLRERKVNAYELKIDSDCEDAIALYAPVAIDLRFILAVLKINTNLERIADFAEGIARFIITFPSLNMEAELLNNLRIERMVTELKEMLQLGQKAFNNENSLEAAQIFTKDALVDEINNNAPEIISKYIEGNPERALSGLNLIGIIRKMERVGDHCNNIAEEIIFFLDAKILKHNKNSSKEGE